MNEPAQWVYQAGSGCAYCKDGLCSRMNELMEQGKSKRAASRIMEEECGGKWKAETIRKLFERFMGTTVPSARRGREREAVLRQISPKQPAGPEPDQEILELAERMEALGRELSEAAEQGSALRRAGQGALAAFKAAASELALQLKRATGAIDRAEEEETDGEGPH